MPSGGLGFGVAEKGPKMEGLGVRQTAMQP